MTVSVVGADTLRRNSGLIVLSGLEDENLTARLRVDVPQREYNTVTASNYNPRVDLTRITEAGEQTLRINTTSTSTYGTVRGISPETITVVVDQFVTNYRVPRIRQHHRRVSGRVLRHSDFAGPLRRHPQRPQKPGGPDFACLCGL